MAGTHRAKMETALTPGDVQTLRRIGKRLLKPETYLRPNAAGDGFRLFRRDRPTVEPDVACDTVGRWLASDLMEKTDNGLVLNVTGRAWVRRHLERGVEAGDGFQAQHQLRKIYRTDEGIGVQRNVGQTALEWARLRPNGSRFGISDAEFAAGMQLQTDVFKAQGPARTCMDWSRPDYVDGGGYSETDHHYIDARRRVRAALEYVGPGLSDFVLDMCCELRGLEDHENVFALPRRSGRLVLKLGLSRLAVFYDLQTSSEAVASFRMR